MKNKTEFIILLIILLLAFLINFDFTLPLATEKIEGFQIHYIDVGQADATAIFFPNGKTMLIDGGNSDDGIIIKNHFKRYGIEKIDYLIATHPHEDHIGGLSYVIDNFTIGEIFMPKVTYDSSVYTELLDKICNLGYTINTAKKGICITESEDYIAEILSPVRSSYDDINHYSVILKITYKNTAFLFTGDAESINENELNGNISADVLKVGHHGSDTSSTEAFLDKVNPDIAVIHVGKDNSYNHPHDIVLKRLKNRNVKILRTDIDGTVIIKSDGDNVTYKGENNEVLP